MNPSIQTHVLVPSGILPGYLAIPYIETGFYPEVVDRIKSGDRVIAFSSRRDKALLVQNGIVIGEN